MHASHSQADTLPGVDARPAERATPRPLAPGGDQAVALDVAGGRWSAAAGLGRRTDPAAPRGLTRALAVGRRDPRAPRRGPVPLPARRQPRGWPSAAGEDEAHDAPPCATRRSARGAAGVGRPPWPPGLHHRRARGAPTLAHAPRAPAWPAGAWRKVSPPPPAPPRAASSTSRTPRPPSLARRHRPVTLALRAALAACRCPWMRAGQGACARRAARPRAAPARRGARGGPAGARGAGLRGPPPWCSCAGPATWPPLRGGRGARPPPTAVRAPG